MNKYRRELVRGLFTAATEILEDHHELACEGQSPKVVRAQYEALAKRLAKAGQHLSQVAAAILVLTEPAAGDFVRRPVK